MVTTNINAATSEPLYSRLMSFCCALSMFPGLSCRCRSCLEKDPVSIFALKVSFLTCPCLLVKRLVHAQVKSAYSSSTQVQRSNYDYIRVFASRWRSFAEIPVAAILTHLNVSAPQDSDRRALRDVVSRRALGTKLLCAGELLDSVAVHHSPGPL